MAEDPATWAAASYTPDLAGEVDSADDLYRQTILDKWPGKVKPDGKAVSMILGMVDACIVAGTQAGFIDGTPETTGGNHGIIIKFLELLEGAENPALHFRCLRYVFNLESESQTAIAARFGVSRACVSQVCVRMANTLGVLPGRGMRSLEARETYKERAEEVHSRGPAQAANLPDEQDDWSSIVDSVVFDTGPVIDANLANSRPHQAEATHESKAA